MTEPSLVRTTVADRVAVVTLADPKRRNALNLAINDELIATFADLEQRDDVGAVVITGEAPAFCAGADLSQLGDSQRDGLLAILTIGPAYGHQLLGELAARAPHRGPVNVGQIYSTLDRLGGQRLVESAGLTTDGLPLHTLTPAGVTAARSWMTEPTLDPLPEWTELLDQLLITSSVDPVAASALTGSLRLSPRAASRIPFDRSVQLSAAECAAALDDGPSGASRQ